jgi:hypothetical protein
MNAGSCSVIRIHTHKARVAGSAGDNAFFVVGAIEEGSFVTDF